MERNYEPFFITIGMLSGILAFISLFLPFATVFTLFGEVSGFNFYQEMLSNNRDTFGVISSYIAGVVIVSFGSMFIILRYFKFIDGNKLLRILFLIGGFLLLFGDLFIYIFIALRGITLGGSLFLGFWVSVVAGLLAFVNFILSFFVTKESNNILLD